MKLPLEELKEKYLPASVYPEKYGISIPTIMRLVETKKIRPAEFRSPGESRRSLYVNYEEVLAAVKEEENS